MITLTENEYKNRKNHIVESCSYNTVDMVKSCLCSECAKCKGNCCSNYPCTLSPREFIDINNIEYMKNVLDIGVLAIAPGNILCKYYIIRPRGSKDLDTIVTGYVEAPNSCILQGPKGCILDPLFRPTDGLLLMPERHYKEIKCVPHYSEFKVMEDWLKYQDVLRELRKIYKDKEIDMPPANEETAKKYTLAMLGCKKGTK
ncbi:MAG: hypothetical protein IKP98_02965 [Bacilli bacterium]|nr:hypothetical protein [Bacilli bacterium]